jgi:hypothetical protein
LRSKKINIILKRSAELEEVLVSLFKISFHDNSARAESSKIMCSVSFEHAESAKMLVAAGNITSALGLVRLQYEAFVRAMWLYFAATDTAVSKLMADLTNESAKRADRLPMLSEMLKKLEGKAPQVVLDQLLEFKEYSWKPLSSYVHGGIHAVHRHSLGYPKPLLIQALKTSNGLSIMVGMFLVILSRDQSQSGKMPKLQFDYIDCLPDFKYSF